jgi:hypothetical protein
MLHKQGLEYVDCIQLSLKDPLITDDGPACSIQGKDFSSSHEQLSSSQEGPCADV